MFYMWYYLIILMVMLVNDLLEMDWVGIVFD